MTWARLDDGFHGHPKIHSTTLAGRGLFVTALSYAAHYLTDGFVRERVMHDMARVRHGRAALRELIERGLIERSENGYMIHDFLDFNPSRREVEEEREKNREKQAKRRARHRQSQLPWDESGPPRTPGTTPGGSTGREGEGTTTSEEGRELHAPDSDLEAIIDEVLEILAASPRITIDPIQTRIGVENLLLAHPDKDPVVAARKAVATVSDPAFRMTSPTRLLDMAFERMNPGERRPEFEESVVTGAPPAVGKCRHCKAETERKVLTNSGGLCDRCFTAIYGEESTEEATA